MANEIKSIIDFSVKTAGGAQVARYDKLQITMTGDAVAHYTQSIPTSNTTLNHNSGSLDTDIGTAGMILIKNLDATNYVSIGLTGSYTIKLKAKETCVFRAAGDLWALANTAACNIEVIVCED